MPGDAKAFIVIAATNDEHNVAGVAGIDSVSHGVKRIRTAAVGIPVDELVHETRAAGRDAKAPAIGSVRHSVQLFGSDLTTVGEDVIGHDIAIGIVNPRLVSGR